MALLLKLGWRDSLCKQRKLFIIMLEDWQALLNCLSAHRDQKFRAAELENETGVPKSHVRDLLTGSSRVKITTGETLRIPSRVTEATDAVQKTKIYWYQWLTGEVHEAT